LNILEICNGGRSQQTQLADAREIQAGASCPYALYPWGMPRFGCKVTVEIFEMPLSGTWGDFVHAADGKGEGHDAGEWLVEEPHDEQGRVSYPHRHMRYLRLKPETFGE
jgi:hypothetical protein